jgi:hypothetical protein
MTTEEEETREESDAGGERGVLEIGQQENSDEARANAIADSDVSGNMRRFLPL